MEQKRALEIVKEENAETFGLDRELFKNLDPDLIRSYIFTDNDIWVILNALIMLRMNYSNNIQIASVFGENSILNEFIDRLEEIWVVHEKIKNKVLSADWHINVGD